MRALVTGAAGFIGSNLVDALLADGITEVVGVDCLTPYYDPAVKVANLGGAREHDRFRFVEADLRDAALDALVEDVDFVFHQAGQPGVRLSWSDGFGQYESCNIAATQRLLEACRRRVEAGNGPRRVVFASSSSVYGNAERYPTVETDLPRPASPYGITKLAAEHLCSLYAETWGVPAVSLRYFTVYGPRQRPDMAIHRLIEAGLGATPFPLYGTGEQVREFTFVGDIVRANLAAARREVPSGSVFNVAGGSTIVVRDLIRLVGEIVGTPIPVESHDAAPGDARENGGSTDLARQVLGWEPSTPLPEGIAAQVRWHRDRMTA